MAHFGLKIKKSEAPNRSPYTIYSPHTRPVSERNWNQGYYQVISIDPARKNYAMRIERRYHNGWIVPLMFDKISVDAETQEGESTICNMYEMLTAFFQKYEQFYDDTHYVIIEKQLPQNYKPLRIAQHTITYFSLRLHDKPLLPSIIEVDSKVKGKVLGAPKGITESQLKSWAVEKARELLTIRKDTYSLSVLDHFRSKQDDLSDTVCQAEAVFISWGLLGTIVPPDSGPAAVTPAVVNVPVTLAVSAPRLTLVINQPTIPVVPKQIVLTLKK